MPANFDHLLLPNQELLSIKHNFVQEIQNASERKESSVSFLRHTIPQSSPLKDGEIFQVMTVGGSIFKTALVKKQGDSFVILEENKANIPFFSTEQIFLQFLERYLDPAVTYLSLNLACYLEPAFRNDLLDGVLIRGGKGHAFEGLLGKMVGKTVGEYMFSKQKRTLHVTVANDTICLFLSDITVQTWNTTVAGIIGTGTNYAIGVNGQIINLQSGNFNKFLQSESGKQIDQTSMNPGKALIEKEIAGAYLFRHYNIIAKENNLSFSPLSSTKELSALAEKNDGDASKLAQIILERSASFAACQMAGIVDFLTDFNRSQPISTNFNFVMEGALYWDAWNYKELILKYLKVLKVLNKIRFSPVRHHSIRGGIKLLAGLS